MVDHIAKLEADNMVLNGLLHALVGEETLHQEGQYEKEMQRLRARMVQLGIVRDYWKKAAEYMTPDIDSI